MASNPLTSAFWRRCCHLLLALWPSLVAEKLCLMPDTVLQSETGKWHSFLYSCFVSCSIFGVLNITHNSSTSAADSLDSSLSTVWKLSWWQVLQNENILTAGFDSRLIILSFSIFGCQRRCQVSSQCLFTSGLPFSLYTLSLVYKLCISTASHLACFSPLCMLWATRSHVGTIYYCHVLPPFRNTHVVEVQNSVLVSCLSVISP